MRWGTKHRLSIGFFAALTFFLVIVGFSLAIQETSETTATEESRSIQRFEEVKALLNASKYAEAEAMAREILADVEAKHGVDSLEAAKVIDVLAEALIGDDEQIEDECRSLIERAVSIRKQIYGPENSEIAQSLYHFARLYWKKGNFEEALPHIDQALTIGEKTYGPEHKEIGRILHGYAYVLDRTGDKVKARKLYERALGIREKELGPEHIEVSHTLNNLGLLLSDISQFEKAKSCFLRSLAIREKALGPEHKQVAFAIDNLASLLHTMGAYADAKLLYERLLPLLENEFGPEHPRTASCWNDLGYLLKDMGEYRRARQCHESALTIREKVFGPDHPAVAYSLNNLAVVLRWIGDYERAQTMLERSLTILEKTFGPDHPSLALPLNNLANVLDALDDIQGSLFVIRRAFEIREKYLGADNVNLAPYIVNYSVQLSRVGDYDKAIALQHRALELQEKNFGPDHPDNSTILINLANFYNETGAADKAVPLIARAETIAEKSVGANHPQMALILRTYSTLLWSEGELDQALAKALRSEEIVRERLSLLTRSLSEREALAYVSTKSFYGLDIFFSLAANHPDEIEGVVSKAWDAFIRSRALVLDEMAARHRTTSGIDDPEIAALANSLTSARQQLADLVVRGPGSGSPGENYQAILDKAMSEKEQAERRLAEASAAFKEQMEISKAGLSEVKASLPQGFALVAFGYYWHTESPLKAKEGEGAESHDQSSIPCYVAFVLSGRDEKPKIVPLGRADEIEPLVFDWGQEASRGTRIPGRSAEESELAYRSAGEALRRRVWDPILPHLGNPRCVVIVPSNVLHTVNFSALPVGRENFLVDEGPLIHYLSAERDLLPTGESAAMNTGLLALGDPAFDDSSLFAALSEENKPKQSLIQRAKSLLSFRGTRSECGDFKSLRFDSLPSANKEIKEVTDIWKKSKRRKGDILKLTGDMANEGAFKEAAPGKQMIHFATHGFFLEGNCPSVLTSSVEQRGSEGQDEGALSSVTAENPLLLTGLALAGANNREAAGPEEEDGILTAEEIAALDLSGVNWAILSACDTGAGEIRGGEGVFGLRRAFRIAGVRTLITSLWAVEDEVARKWMKSLYKSLFSKGQGTAVSVREASLEVLRDLRRKKKSTHPFYWAGFVASGDWK
ncbi:tetratricopeptide repeat protein [Acidobacteriota bacterium]